jgi:hypothetical protein
MGCGAFRRSAPIDCASEEESCHFRSWESGWSLVSYDTIIKNALIFLVSGTYFNF